MTLRADNRFSAAFNKFNTNRQETVKNAASKIVQNITTAWDNVQKADNVTEAMNLFQKSAAQHNISIATDYTNLESNLTSCKSLEKNITLGNQELLNLTGKVFNFIGKDVAPSVNLTFLAEGAINASGILDGINGARADLQEMLGELPSTSVLGIQLNSTSNLPQSLEHFATEITNLLLEKKCMTYPSTSSHAFTAEGTGYQISFCGGTEGQVTELWEIGHDAAQKQVAGSISVLNTDQSIFCLVTADGLLGQCAPITVDETI